MFKKISIQQRNPDVLEIVQITDCHIFSDSEKRFDGVDTAASLKRVIELINDAESPDIVMATGDLVNDAEVTAYHRLLTLFKMLKTPVYCLPGNHDNPEMMHDILNKGNIATTRVIDGNFWRLILLDTVITGSHSGYLVREELAFLDDTLRQTGSNPVLIALHHHPVSVNSPWMDTMILENPDDFFTVVDRFPAVKGIIWGHIHQEFARQRNMVKLMGTPSTCRQFRLETPVSAADDKPPGYRRISLLKDGSLRSEVVWLQKI
jgi:3',5'-cyclic-AMP phosphodiesterase